MAQSKIVVWGFLIGAVLFIFAALVGIARGENLNAALVGIGAACFAVAAVFIALNGARPRKQPPSDSAPPAV